MTELRGQVEPPFSKRSVQRTIAAIAIIAALWQTVRFSRLCSAPPARENQELLQHRPRERGEHRSPLIQIDLNRAEPRELTLLPGVGPILARRIVEDRQQHGPFESVESLRRVPGIGVKTMEQINQIGFVEKTMSRDPTERTNADHFRQTGS